MATDRKQHAEPDHANEERVIVYQSLYPRLVVNPLSSYATHGLSVLILVVLLLSS